MTNIITVLIHGPLCGATKRNPALVHAIDIEAAAALAKGRAVVTAPCGAKNVRFIVSPDGLIAPWPLRADGPITRCRECWVATGKKRPRCTFATAPTASGRPEAER